MGVKRYLSVGGQLLAEYQVDTDEYIGYMSDALGNVSSTVGSGGDKVNEYLYSPFGEMVKKTGTYPDPKYLWCGTWGYRANGNKWVSHYVRARHYSFADAAWTSIDPLWPSEMAYGYVEGRVMTSVDPSGKQTNSSRGRKLKECSVYFCDVFWPRHRFVCVSILRPDGSSRQCSGGFYPKPKEPVNTNAIFGRGFIGDEPNVVGSCPVEGDRNVKCTPVNRAWNSKQGCDFADKVCKCIDRARKDPGLYQFATNNCYNFADWVIECACAESGALVGWLGDTCREFFSRGFYRK